MKEIFEEFVDKNVTVYLKTNRRFSGKLVAVFDEFLKINDRYCGLKIIALTSIENVEEWKR